MYKLIEISDPWTLCLFVSKIFFERRVSVVSKRIGCVYLGKVFECSPGTYHTLYIFFKLSFRKIMSNRFHVFN